MENTGSTIYTSSPNEMDAEKRERIRKELESARRKQPLRSSDFTAEEIEALKELAPGEYDHLKEQMEKKDGSNTAEDEKG